VNASLQFWILALVSCVVFACVLIYVVRPRQEAVNLKKVAASHFVFSFFFGWHEYMPFLRIPSLHDLAGAG